MNYRDSDEKKETRGREENEKRGMGGGWLFVSSLLETRSGGGVPAGQRSSRREQLRHSLLYANANMIT